MYNLYLKNNETPNTKQDFPEIISSIITIYTHFFIFILQITEIKNKYSQ
jgi:hypothetical protein